MAMQVGFAKIALVAGAGFTTTFLFQNGKLSDIIGELQNMVKNMEPSRNSETDSDYNEAVNAQVRRLTQEVRRLLNERQVTVYGHSGQSNLVSLAGPAAALGALGYGYMWWKGVSFSDLMYVTKRGMATAVESLTKNLENVSEAVAAAKKHLTQRIENLDGKLDQQVEMSKLLRDEVNGVHYDISQIGCNVEVLESILNGLDGKLQTLEQKQDYSNAGIAYLCNFVDGRKAPMPQVLQEQFKLAASTTQGLKDFLLPIEPAQDDSDNKLNRITRASSIKC